MDQTEDRVRKIVADVLRMKPESIALEAKLAEDLGASSLDLVDIVMEIENGFKLEIDDDQAAELLTLQHVLDFLSTASSNPGKSA